MKLILAFFLLPIISLGQTIYKGTIRVKKNNEPIPFATVGLMMENTGTTTDETGIFELKSVKSFPDDTLIVTCLGYQVSKIEVSNLDTSKIELLLTEKSFNLKEIVVSNKSKKDILNDFDDTSRNYASWGYSMIQVAQHFQTKNSNCQLIKVKICDGSVIYGKKIARYRLRIYAMDPITKGPSTDLCSHVIEVRTKLKRTGIYSINLEKYKIMIPDNDFFIAVEWLNIKENESKEVFKDGITTYLPGIVSKQKTNLTLEAWYLSYKNIWLPSQGTLLIAATVKH